MTTIEFSVPGMTCGHCERAVTTEMSKIGGVRRVDVDLDTKRVIVESDNEIAWADVEAAIDEAGFEAVRS